MAKAFTKVPVFDTGLTTEQLAKDTDDRFAKNEILIYSVLVIVAITLVSVVLAEYGLILDQEHFNNETYRSGVSTTKTVEKTNTNTVEQQEQPIVFPNMKATIQ